AGDNFLIGRDSDDILLGGDGADRVRGDAGEDFIDGGAGTDLLDFSAESINGDRNGFQPLNGVFVNLAALVTIDSFGDRDVVRNVENVRGTDFDDIITGDDLANVLEGRGGNDRLTGGAGDDTVLAGAGFDTIVAGSGAGNDTYDGGDDDDTITFESTTSGVTVDLSAVQDQAIGAETGTDQIANVEDVIGGSGDDTITGDGSDNRLEGGAGIDTLNGGAGNDDLIGGAGNDIINGGDGSDFIRPGAGNDTIDGGADFDVVSYREDATGPAGITYTGGVDPSNGDTTGTVTGDASIGTDSLRNIEMIVGTEFQDVFNGGAGDERFDPLGGIDTINGGGGDFDQLAYQSATPGLGNSGVTITFTAPGTGTAFDTAGDLDSFTGIEMAFGSAGNDVITMSTADFETVFASRGNDDVDGGAGIGDNISYCCDNFFGVSINLATGIADDGAGSVHQLSGFENADGSSGSDQITGDGGGNNLFGLDGGDTIDGGAGDDFLFGNEGDDILAGGLNDDVLSGGLGLDELTGGAGADDFEFVNGTLDADDLIFDFDVNEIDAILLNVQAAAEVGSDANTDSVDDFLRVIDDGVNGLVLQADVDGAGGAAGFETIADFVDEANLGAGIQVTVIDDDGSNVSGNIIV
ncbi:MAG: calcium-binding protein, partial [Methyloligellaceae bacterium]